jgi:hypothetical protein
VPSGARVLRVQLPPDALAVDDAAWLVADPPRVVAVADTLPPPLREQLRLDEVLAALRDWRAETDRSRAQLVVASAPGAIGAGQLEVVVETDGETRSHRGPFVLDRAHPWLHGVALDGVVWTAPAAALRGDPLVAAGGVVLAAEERLVHGRRLWLALRGDAGNVVRAADWPVLFANLLDACRDAAPGVVSAHVAVGDEARVVRAAVAAGAAAAPPPVLVTPAGERRPGHGGDIVGWIVHEPGVHRVLDAGGTELGVVAASFRDVAESDLSRCTTGRRAAAATPAADRAAPWRDAAWERRVLALLVLLLVAADWWVLAGRGR